MQFFSSDKRLQENIFQNPPSTPQELKGRPLKTVFHFANHKREIFSCILLVGKWLLVMIFIYDLYSLYDHGGLIFCDLPFWKAQESVTLLCFPPPPDPPLLIYDKSLTSSMC